MKCNAIKTISIIIALILLISALSACENADVNEKDEIPLLSPEKETELKERFYKKYKNECPSLTLDDIKVSFFGEFNGAYAIMIETDKELYMPDVYEVINGREFVYPNTQPMNILHDGKLYLLEEAYNIGLITDEDLYLLSKRCRPVCKATLDDEFDTKRILVKVMPSSNFKEYTPEDFSEINCIKVEDLFNTGYKEGELDRWMVLTIKSYSKRTILKAIDKLEQRDDVYYAQPDYLVSID